MEELAKHWQDKSTSTLDEHTKKLESYLINSLQRRIEEAEKEKEAAIQRAAKLEEEKEAALKQADLANKKMARIEP